MSEIMRLYHGSERVIERPRYKYGKTDNDYGQGFYCTREKEMAKEWACQKDSDGFINEYILNTEGLNILYLNAHKYSILHWLSILIQNREVDDIENEEAIDFLKENYSIDTSSYDVIIGYRADDSYFTFARDFVNDGITLETLSSAMRLGALGIQVMLKSKKAFEQIKFVKQERVPKDVYHPKYIQRDKDARNSYQKLRRTPKSNGIIMTEIIKNPKLVKDFEAKTRKTVITRKQKEKSKSDDDTQGY